MEVQAGDGVGAPLPILAAEEGSAGPWEEGLSALPFLALSLGAAVG